MIKNKNFTAAKAAMMVLALNSLAAASTFSFTTDPLQGTTVRNTAGRQVVGGELFVSFFTATDVYAFDEPHLAWAARSTSPTVPATRFRPQVSMWLYSKIWTTTPIP